MFISPSIKEAFQNGSGDFCFQNSEGFAFVSRHIITEEFMKEMEGKGFKYIPYLEVLEQDRKEKVEALSKLGIPEPIKAPAPKIQKETVNISCGAYQHFIEEFPDGLNQSL